MKLKNLTIFLSKILYAFFYMMHISCVCVFVFFVTNVMKLVDM